MPAPMATGPVALCSSSSTRAEPSKASPGNQFGRHRLLSQVLRHDVHQRLVHILDNAVIRGSHVQVHIGQAGAAAAIEPGQRYGAQPIAWTTLSEFSEALIGWRSRPNRRCRRRRRGDRRSICRAIV